MNERLESFPLKEYENRYKVCITGKIWSNRKKEYLKTTISNDHVIFYVNKTNSKNTQQFRLDIIIAMTFGDQKDKYLEHIDKNNLNNDISNLRWIDIIDYLKNEYHCDWKHIQNYEKYLVSSNGEIWSMYISSLIKTRIIAGYVSVNIGYPKSFLAMFIE